MTESTLKEHLVTYMVKRGIVAWRNPVGPYSRAGLPDILGVLPGGRLIAIEAKRPGKYKTPQAGLTPAQAKWLDTLRAQGAIALAIDELSLGWEAIDNVLEETHHT